MIRKSLRTRLILMFVTLSIIPTVVVGMVSWQGYRLQRRQALALQREIATRAVTLINSYLVNAEEELRAINQIPGFKVAELEKQQEVLSQAIFYRAFFDELARIDPNGLEQVRVSRLGIFPNHQLRDLSGTEEFQIAMRHNQTFFGPVTFSEVNGEPLLLLVVPTLDATSGQPDGVLTAQVRMAQIFEEVTSIKVGETGEISVVTEDGRIVAHAGPHSDSLRFTVPPNGFTVGTHGTNVVLSSSKIELGRRSLTIVVEVAVVEAFRIAIETATVTVLLLLVALTTALIVGNRTVNAIVRPISVLAKASQVISAGDLSQQVATTHQDEIGTLQHEFNHMVINLRDQRQEIEERTIVLQERLEAERELIKTVAALSSPLLPVWEGVVVMPVIGHVDTRRGEAITDALVRGVAEQNARVAILDITGISMLDTQILGILLRAMQAIELLGTTPVLAGISATAARLIVQQGIDLGSIRTARDLRSAVEQAVSELEAPISE